MVRYLNFKFLTLCSEQLHKIKTMKMKNFQLKQSGLSKIYPNASEVVGKLKTSNFSNKFKVIENDLEKV